MRRRRSRAAGLRLRISTLFLIPALALLGAAAARASNGLQNPSFDTGVTGWSAVDGNITWVSGVDVDGCAASGSALVSDPELVTTNWTVTAVSSGSCVPTVADATLHYNLRAFALASIQHTDLAVLGYTDEACTTGEVEVPIAGFGPLSAVWVNFQLGITLDPSISSVRALVRMSDDSNSTYQYRLDSAYLGYDVPIFIDGFEAGFDCRWSSVVPAPEPGFQTAD